jgi:hypothetical protein
MTTKFITMMSLIFLYNLCIYSNNNAMHATYYMLSMLYKNTPPVILYSNPHPAGLTSLRREEGVSW